MYLLRRFLIITVLAFVGVSALTGCIEDGMSASPSDQPVFSTDTVRMGTLFTLDASPTNRFIVYNRHDKGVNISSIEFADDPEGIFRMNVDGMSGKKFSDVEIRANDSIFVFVEATLPENGRDVPVDVLGHIEFRCNGVTSRMPVKAQGRDVIRFKGDTRIASDATLAAGKPYHITDSIVVEEGATLTIAAGAELLFHSESELIVHGTLRVEGTPEHPVNITGDRTGFVAAQIPYEIMSGQWGGIYFSPTSTGNEIYNASIRNAEYGIIADRCQGAPALRIVNSQVRNTKWYVLDAIHTSVEAAGCEFAEASMGILRLIGGVHTINHCTIANYYLFTALGGAAVQLAHLNPDNLWTDPETEEPSELPFISAEFANTIIYGNGSDLSHGDLTDTGVFLRRCLLKSNGSDDDNFLSCIWGEDPLYHTVREEYLFDYTLKPESPAASSADASLTSPLTAVDRLGHDRGAEPSIGAYQFVAE
jgi:hypothetical protein